MTQWHVRVCDRNTGREQIIQVDAATQASAEQIAADAGWLVGGSVSAAQPMPPPVVPKSSGPTTDDILLSIRSELQAIRHSPMVKQPARTIANGIWIAVLIPVFIAALLAIAITALVQIGDARVTPSTKPAAQGPQK